VRFIKVGRVPHSGTASLPYVRSSLIGNSQLTVPQTSIAIAASITVLGLTYSQIHADAPSAGDAIVPEPRAGKTDERTLQGEGLIPMSEVAKHARREDCWVVIGGQVWDMTNVSSSSLPLPLSSFLLFALIHLIAPDVERPERQQY
jgi:hypothetical protein